MVVAPVYATVRPEAMAGAHLHGMIEAGAIDLVTFTSPSMVTNWIALTGEAGKRCDAAVIGPITAEGLVTAIQNHYIVDKMKTPGVPQ